MNSYNMTLNLHTALTIFEDHLTEIKDALTSTILEDLQQFPTVSSTVQEDMTWVTWVRHQVREAQVKELTEGRLRTIKRIITRQQSKLTHKTGQITDEMIEQAREVPIEDMVDTRVFTSTGKWIACCHCPLPGHGGERTPSFYIDKHNRFKCFGCDEHGDSIELYMKQHAVTFIQAVKILSSL